MEVCLRSLLKGGDEVEIIIVDDGSTDDTGRIADSYALKFPKIVKAIHQPNGGHGAGIMTALNVASGKYFKVVDSDDWVNQETLDILLARIRENREAPDLYITDYQYFKGEEGTPSKRISYSSSLPALKEFSWNKIGKFNVASYLTLHSCMYETTFIKNLGVSLPKKTYYEDNYFIYKPLPYVTKAFYLPFVFYCYNVGRPDQSVTKRAGIAHFRDHLAIAKLMFLEHDLYRYKDNRRLFSLMYHQLRLVFIIAILHTRMSKDKQAKTILKDFYGDIRAENPRQYKRLRYFSAAMPICLPGFVGVGMSHFLYWLAHEVVRFN